MANVGRQASLYFFESLDIGIRMASTLARKIILDWLTHGRSESETEVR